MPVSFFDFRFVIFPAKERRRPRIQPLARIKEAFPSRALPFAVFFRVSIRKQFPAASGQGGIFCFMIHVINPTLFLSFWYIAMAENSTISPS